MSYDLQVWSVRPVQAASFHKPELWKDSPHAWTHEEKRWQLVVSHSDRVLTEDVPEEVSSLLPGIEYLTNLNLEGQAPERGYKLAQSTANHLARAARGVVANPQEDSFQPPSGIKRFASAKNEAVFDVVALSWWFLDSPLPTREGFSTFLELLESMLPEALPKRYGDYEPPQNVYAETGKEHFLTFAEKSSYEVSVWYPHRPVAGAYLSTPHPMGAFQLGFRTGYICIEVERSALSQPGWNTNLQRFWKKASSLIRPIYGDVRILGGYSRYGAAAFTNPGYAEHPVPSWWWAGIPKDLGIAVVLGREYQRLWPRFVSSAEIIDGLAFATINDWADNADLADVVGLPPADQSQISPKPTFGNRRYPTGWPFGPQFLPRETPNTIVATKKRKKPNPPASQSGLKSKLLSFFRRTPDRSS